MVSKKRSVLLGALILVILIVVVLVVDMFDSPFDMAATTVSVRVLSYNIHHGRGMDDVLDLQRIGDVILQSEAELVGLQEVDRHYGARSNFEDQAKWLAGYVDMHYVYAANLDLDPATGRDQRRQYGVAILSKYPIVNSNHYLLSSFGQEQRGLLEATIEVEDVHVHFYSTHLGLTPEQREAQAQEIMDITRSTAAPKILVGDFNARSTSLEMRTLQATYTDAFARKLWAMTSNSKFPVRRIDYILVDAERVRFTNSKVMRTQASDHLPIVTDVKVKVSDS